MAFCFFSVMPCFQDKIDHSTSTGHYLRMPTDSTYFYFTDETNRTFSVKTKNKSHGEIKLNLHLTNYSF